MKILVVSYAFSPSVGGIENSSDVLAAGFAGAGNEVRLVTHEIRVDAQPRSFRVIRRPQAWLLWRLYRWADVVFHNNVSLRYLWLKWITGRRCVVTTQTWLSGTPDIQTIGSCVKQAVLASCTNIAISNAIRRSLGARSIVIGNPYDATVFRPYPNVLRAKSLLFVGRLVSDKGLDLLIRSVESLLRTGIEVKLTVAGDGPCRLDLEKMA